MAIVHCNLFGELKHAVNCMHYIFTYTSPRSRLQAWTSMNGNDSH